MNFDQILDEGGVLDRDSRPSEIYVDVPLADVASAAEYLRSAGCRHVALFAEDRTEAESRYLLYYVFEHPQDTRYLRLRAPAAG